MAIRHMWQMGWTTLISKLSNSGLNLGTSQFSIMSQLCQKILLAQKCSKVT